MPDFDAISKGNSGGNVTSITYSHTVGSGSNRALFVGVSLSDSDPAAATTTVTYGGTALTHVVTRNRVGFWWLLDPPVGTADVVVTLDSADDISSTARSYTDVNQTTPVSANNTADVNGTSISASVSSEEGELVIDFLAKRAEAEEPSPDANQTERTSAGEVIDTEGRIWAKASEKDGASSVTMGWSWSASRPASLIVASIAPSTAAPRTQAVIIS